MTILAATQSSEVSLEYGVPTLNAVALEAGIRSSYLLLCTLLPKATLA